MKVFLICLVLVSLADKVKPECPAVDDLPVYHGGSNTFFCARHYYGTGSDLAINACNGCSLQNYADWVDGENLDAGAGRLYPVGSLIVRPGCTFYQFSETGYNGGWNVFEGPGIWPKIESGGNPVDQGCAKGHPAIMCRCKMRHFSCTPEDGYDVVMVCDATNAQSDSECNYRKTIGTSHAETFSSSMSIDVTIEAEMTAKFFEMFSATLGSSVSTGYNWNQVSSETMDEEHTIEILATAPKGYVLRIEQAIGTCDGSTAKTELFRITHTNQKGEIVKLEHQKMFLNGTIVKLQ